MSPFLAQAAAVGTTLLPVAAVFVALALLTKRRGVIGAAWQGRREMLTNAGLVVVNYILLAPLMLVPVLAVRAVLPVPSAFITKISAPGEWRFHATHHADEALSWLTVLRKHPVGKFLELLVDTLPLLLLGAPAWAIVAAQLIRGWWGHFIHADVPWTLGPAGRVLMSPAAHRLHHIRDETLMGSNYGNMLTLWDRLFGTWRDPAPYLNCATGIAEGTRGVWGELARPWEARYRSPPPAPDDARRLA